MTPTPDPNWLLSTTAQSAAALVAIIGGLLVSRLVALAVERDGLQRRLTELEGELKIATSDVTEAERPVTWQAQSWFIEQTIEAYIAARGLPGERDRDFRSLGSTEEQRLLWQEQLAFQVVECLDEIEGLLRPDDRDLDIDILRDRGFEMGHYDARVVKPVVKSVRGRVRAAHRSRFDIPSITPFNPGSRISNERAEQVEAIAELGRRRATRRRLEAQVGQVNDHLRQLGKPKGVGWGILALAIFAILGVAFPLTLMALRPIPTGDGWRIAVVSAFLVGLVLVIAFIASQWRSLRRLDQVQPVILQQGGSR